MHIHSLLGFPWKSLLLLQCTWPWGCTDGVMTVPLLLELTVINVVEYVESGTLWGGTWTWGEFWNWSLALQVDRRRTFGAVGIVWAKVWGCVSWTFGSSSLWQGRLWVTWEGVWIQSYRKWGATDKFYVGGLSDLIAMLEKLTLLVPGTVSEGYEPGN